MSDKDGNVCFKLLHELDKASMMSNLFFNKEELLRAFICAYAWFHSLNYMKSILLNLSIPNQLQISIQGYATELASGLNILKILTDLLAKRVSGSRESMSVYLSRNQIN